MKGVWELWTYRGNCFYKFKNFPKLIVKENLVPIEESVTRRSRIEKMFCKKRSCSNKRCGVE